MKIVIQIANEVCDEAFHRVKQLLHATELHDPSFNGCDLIAERGDFTCIDEGSTHSDSAGLFAAVQEVIMHPFERDLEGHLMIPVRAGGVVRD